MARITDYEEKKSSKVGSSENELYQTAREIIMEDDIKESTSLVK
jgi:hypothetical protein